MGAPTHATATHIIVVGELVGLHGVFGRQGAAGSRTGGTQLQARQRVTRV